jgi:peptidoglycan/xylan/chitin deacetylase (PgdA/CDA1 family)
MSKLILTYHASRSEGPGRGQSDLVALQADLAWMADRGVVLRGLDDLLDPACETGVALTFDDGTRMDAEAIEHPRHGCQTSVLEVLRRWRQRWPGLTAAAFVIASPVARAQLSAALAAEYGPDLMHDRWWRAATLEGLLQIENHSWDHNHEVASPSCQRDNQRGTFANIDTETEAEAEIAQASAFIEARCQRRPAYFAYPYGDTSAFLVERYLPRRGPELGLRAAFTTEPRALRGTDDRWALPRYVAGRDWSSDDGLARILGGVTG